MVCVRFIPLLPFQELFIFFGVMIVVIGNVSMILSLLDEKVDPDKIEILLNVGYYGGWFVAFVFGDDSWECEGLGWWIGYFLVSAAAVSLWGGIRWLVSWLFVEKD